MPVMVHDEKVTVPPTKTPPPDPSAVFSLMVHDEMATVPPLTATPPPPVAVFPWIEEDVIVTVPPWTAIPPPILPPETVLPVMVHDEKVTVPLLM